MKPKRGGRGGKVDENLVKEIQALARSRLNRHAAKAERRKKRIREIKEAKLKRERLEAKAVKAGVVKPAHAPATSTGVLLKRLAETEQSIKQPDPRAAQTTAFDQLLGETE